ncbi:MAG: CinA family nicotinamide mononucleotide deamidase-related protein [Desulfobacterota bacterium]|nr:CinA family nicotinamide mononucleotide deamidase-related protein [Thermodesulfobacteriota bacterium]
MKAEIIAIGSELLLGQILDTNTPWIAKKLAESGIEVVKASAVGDQLSHIVRAIQSSVESSNLVISTGGLGPTEDDLTREAASMVFKRPLQFQPHLMTQIEDVFKRRGFKMPENNRKQAYIPEGSIPIENPKGTAPGFIVEYPNGAFVSIPGVPLEMEFLMEHAILPYVRKRFGLGREIIRYRVLRACGLGESGIALQINDLMEQGRNPSVGTLASVGDIKIRITARANNPEEAESLISKTEQEIRKRLGILIYGTDEETLQGVVARELERRGLTLATFEGFTGGLLSQKLASTGTSSFLQGTVIPHMDKIPDLSKRWLGGAVIPSDPPALAERLALWAKNEANSHLGLVVIGKVLKDQGGGESLWETHYAIASAEEGSKQTYTIGGESYMVQERATILALDLLRKYLRQSS